MREGVAKKEWVTGYTKTDINPSNILTKSLPSSAKRDAEVALCLYDIKFRDFKEPTAIHRVAQNASDCTMIHDTSLEGSDLLR